MSSAALKEIDRSTSPYPAYELKSDFPNSVRLFPIRWIADMATMKERKFEWFSGLGDLNGLALPLPKHNMKPNQPFLTSDKTNLGAFIDNPEEYKKQHGKVAAKDAQAHVDFIRTINAVTKVRIVDHDAQIVDEYAQPKSNNEELLFVYNPFWRPSLIDADKNVAKIKFTPSLAAQVRHLGKLRPWTFRYHARPYQPI